jgi:hypothetical protein
MLALIARNVLTIQVTPLQREGEAMSKATGFTNADVLAQQAPAAQIERHRSIASAAGRDFDESLIPKPPQFTAKTSTEVLLLHEVRSPDDGQGIVPFNFGAIWESIAVPKHDANKYLKPDTVADLAGNPVPGINWVGFDPLGWTFGEESDFRADSFIGHEAYPGSLGGFARAHVTRQVDPATLGGLEVLSALSLMPAYIHQLWVADRGVPKMPVIPRLEAQDNRGFVGAFELSWWPDSALYCHVIGWVSNHYGREWVVPTVRAL